MRNSDAGILYSATDLVRFVECRQLTILDSENLEHKLPKAPVDEQAKLIQDKGIEHERRYWESLQANPHSALEIPKDSLEEQKRLTTDAMHRGIGVIYQAALGFGRFSGYADILVRVERPSALGAWSYEVEDTKFARRTHPKFLLQLAFYSRLVGTVQRLMPENMYVVLGDGSRHAYRVQEYIHYFQSVEAAFLDFVDAPPLDIYPEPVQHCPLCDWRDLCQRRRDTDDHLSAVANIRKSQITKLSAAGIHTLAELGTAATNTVVPGMAVTTFEALRHQASLQLRARVGGERIFECLPTPTVGKRGFARLPPSDAGDLFFDMEGDPLEAGGLEYLFGLCWKDGNDWSFRPFWAHDSDAERQAFIDFMDFVSRWLEEHPQAHIYHYAAYERSALSRLASRHGVCGEQLEFLLKQNKLVDLYQVVREGLRVSEDSYSLKNIERFYRGKRIGDVQNAGASIIFYENWRVSRDTTLLQKIEDYNRDDVESTGELRNWLLQLKFQGSEVSPGADEDTESPVVREKSERALAWEAQLEVLKGKLVPDGLDEARWTPLQRRHALTWRLLDFRRREDSPSWMRNFTRIEQDEGELLEDADCLAGLQLLGTPVVEKRSLRWTYQYLRQECKLRDGDGAVIIDPSKPGELESVSDISFDDALNTVSFKRGAKKAPLPSQISLGPQKPLAQDAMQAARVRFAESQIAQDGRFRALEHLLDRSRPAIRDHQDGERLVDTGREVLPQIVSLVSRLDRSCMFIQGPPGTGKTWTGARLIVALLKAGKRIAVSSNSHKAIHNLLEAVEKHAHEIGFSFSGLKKSSAGSPDTRFQGLFIRSEDSGDSVAQSDQLVAGTAWLLAKEKFEMQFDYLFVDEAGQVALANMVSVGLCARNIVLLGDQMQLGHPTQGSHPGESGDSTLDYLLRGTATIAPDQGVFLDTSWRMHSNVCRFISEAFYDGRLRAAEGNDVQCLLLKEGHDSVLVGTGIRYLPVVHEGCTQQSEAEARAVKILVEDLLRHQFRDRDGVESPIKMDDILTVSPYNMQVDLLKKILPAGSRVGTVDKFQGQEAPVVVVSMATSSGDDIPRDIEFLFSRNRLNVALSRAQCLAVMVASPNLTKTKCGTPDQMKMVDAFCWLAHDQCTPTFKMESMCSHVGRPIVG